MNMDKTKIIFAGCIMIGLIFIGAMMPEAVRTYKGFERTVSVKGLCEKEVPADKVIWPITHKVVGNDLAAINSEVETKNDIISSFLTDGGVKKQDITVSSVTINDKFAQDYGNSDRPYRYVATCIITVCSKDVDKVTKLMSRQNELLKMGLVVTSEWDSKPQFNFEGLNDIKPEMIKEATANAKDVAKKLARDSGSKLGKLKDAAQGTFSIESRDTNTPQIKKVRVVTYVTYYLK